MLRVPHRPPLGTLGGSTGEQGQETNLSWTERVSPNLLFDPPLSRFFFIVVLPPFRFILYVPWPPEVSVIQALLVLVNISLV